MIAEKKRAAHDDAANTKKLRDLSEEHTPAAPVASTAAASPLFLDLTKNSRERLRVQVKQYRGLTYVDLRIWYVGDNGEYAPSNKGVMLKPCQVVEVAQGLLLAGQAIAPQGGR